MKPKPPACTGCPFEHRGRSYVEGQGPLNAKVAFIGQGPGEVEARSGVPFHPMAPSGRTLTGWIESTGFPRDSIWIDNATRCWITEEGSDMAPALAISECYTRHWGPALRALPNLQAVVAVGVPAARFIFGPWANLRSAGTFNWVDLP